MSGLLQINVSEARGFVAVPADLDNLAVVMGCSSAGSGFSAFYPSAASAIAALGYGDAVDTMTQIIEQRQTNGNGVKRPVAFYTTPVTTTGTYGTVDNSSVTGTALFAADSATHPLITSQVRIKWITGCTVGVTGGAYQYSLDGGVNYSNTTGLGTATYISIPNVGIKLFLTPSATSLSALYTKVTLLQTTLTGTGHFTITSGGSPVHASADTADDTALAAVPAASTPATAVTLFNACLNYLGIHGASAVYHAGADAPLAASLAAIPVAANVADVDLHLPALIAAYNAHRINTTGVHGSADATNTITAYVAVPGTLIAGDLAKVRTFAPSPSVADVDAAFTALAVDTKDFSLLAIDFDMTATIAAHVTTGLNALLAQGKRVTALVRTRIPTFESSESDAAWNTAIAADYAAFTDSRICARAGYGLVTDAVTSRQPMRSTFAQFCADVVRSPRAAWPCAPADPQTGASGEPNVTLTDSTGVTVGHDEGPRGASTGLSDPTLGNRFACEQRLPVPAIRESVFNCVPWVLYAADEQIKTLMARRLAHAIERTAVLAAVPNLGGRLFYVSTGPTTGTLTDASRELVHGTVFQALSSEFANEISNANDADLDTGLVQVSPSVTVSGGILTLAITVAPAFPGFTGTLNFTLAVQA